MIHHRQHSPVQDDRDVMISRVFLRLTNACDLACPHCFVDSGQPLMLELSPAQWTALVMSAANAGISEFRLTGGEPLLSPAFWPLVDWAASRRYRVVVTTHGRHVTACAIDHLRDANVVSLWITLHSLEDGSGTHANDPLDAPDVRAALAAHAANVPTGCSLCIHDGNVRLALTGLRMILDAGIRRVRVIFPVPLGRNRLVARACPSPSSWALVCEQVECLQSDYPDAILLYEQPYADGKHVGTGQEVAVFSCGLARCSNLTVDADGGIYPCVLLTRSSRWCLGNVRSVGDFGCWVTQEAAGRVRRKLQIHQMSPTERCCMPRDRLSCPGDGSRFWDTHTICPLTYVRKRILGARAWDE
jgi:radical SAM protein with 4Fe4S-binding SPASM domain